MTPAKILDHTVTRGGSGLATVVGGKERMAATLVMRVSGEWIHNLSV